jgi:hypothetical protein
MGAFKYSMLVLLVLSFAAVFWIFGWRVVAGCTKLLLWALSALCACAGVLTIVSAEGRPLAFIGGFVLWLFAAYLIKVAESLSKGS